MNLALITAIQKTRLILAKHGDHDQSDHGNWADGSGGAKTDDLTRVQLLTLASKADQEAKKWGKELRYQLSRQKRRLGQAEDTLVLNARAKIKENLSTAKVLRSKAKGVKK